MKPLMLGTPETLIPSGTVSEGVSPILYQGARPAHDILEAERVRRRHAGLLLLRPCGHGGRRKEALQEGSAGQVHHGCGTVLLRKRGGAGHGRNMGPEASPVYPHHLIEAER